MGRHELLETVFVKTFFVHMLLNILGVILLVAYFIMPNHPWGYIAACMFVFVGNCICFTVNSVVTMKMLYQAHLYRCTDIQLDTYTARGLQGHIQPSVDMQTQSSIHTYEYIYQPVFIYRFFLLSICTKKHTHIFTQIYTLFLACMYVLGGLPSPVPPFQYI